MAELGYFAFLRHGEYHQRADAPSARQPFALTPQGGRQARLGADQLLGMMVQHDLRPARLIHSSRQLRAWQTARELQMRLCDNGYDIDDIAQSSGLAERGLGSAANLTVGEIEAVLAADPRYGAPPTGWKSDSDYCLPLEGAESLADAGRRVAEHIRRIVQPGLLTIMVGHGASFRHACHELGLLRRDEIARLSMFHARPLLFCHDARGSWRHLAGEWKIRTQHEVSID
ncbi:phosphoglycerate mutase family protein [Paracoccus sp. Z330]|uniref:Phosphoglycerate mutase family protein n=1 Tax=Paracoccus onchidii TaxID=3017813 RepID=A0ABT4ZBG2_9RHOB|nr:histidine phosphatase family protein [Paracoccus onchidii]MDB6175995.1 phosphoglycerate mutase family protein [Paracoccus onchidii]